MEKIRLKKEKYNLNTPTYIFFLWIAQKKIDIK